MITNRHSIQYESFPIYTHAYGTIKYKVYQGTAYHLDTPDNLVTTLHCIRNYNTRVIISYGDTNTGIPWGDIDTGRLGRTTGTIKVPIILHNARSTGGCALLDHCIVSIVESKGKKVLYSVK